MSASLSLGLLRLNDAAPAIWARETGLFREQGLDVRLSVEPSWANIADKLLWGRLQAAVLPPPLAIAIHAGLRGPARRLMIPITISLGGNAVTFSRPLAAALGCDAATPALALGARLRALIAEGLRPRLAVVHVFSTHNLLLRYWLAACGIDPGRDVRFAVVPPERCVQALADDEIDGFCAGAPWGTVAEARGNGVMLLPTQAIWPHHPEKCLAVDHDWADRNPRQLAGLLAALLRAAVACDSPLLAPDVAAMLAKPAYLGLPAALIAQALPQSCFHRFGANRPQLAHAQWHRDQMARWGYGTEPAGLAGLYRPDLYATCAASLQIGEDVPADGAELCDLPLI